MPNRPLTRPHQLAGESIGRLLSGQRLLTKQGFKYIVRQSRDCRQQIHLAAHHTVFARTFASSTSMTFKFKTNCSPTLPILGTAIKGTQGSPNRRHTAFIVAAQCFFLLLQAHHITQIFTGDDRAKLERLITSSKMSLSTAAMVDLTP